MTVNDFQTWRLDDSRQTLVLAVTNKRLPRVIYWGAGLPASENLHQLVQAQVSDVTGGMLDTTPELSICPEAVRSFPGQPGIIVSDTDGTPIHPDFQFENVETGAAEIVFHYQDHTHHLKYCASIGLNTDTHVISASASLSCSTPVRLHWLAAPVLPAQQNSNELIDFSGRWCGEFQTQRTPWSQGMRARENRSGRSGHEHFPGLIIPSIGATNTQGGAYGFHYGWSGGHRMIAEELPDGRRQVQFGHAMNSESQPAYKFETATLFATFSDDGLNGCATAFQRHVRENIVKPATDGPRPVHYNCWEAIYFDHDLEALKDIATCAASLGAERFVLDDGWFGNRNDDTRSLGDWHVDPRKFPVGLGPLIEHVHAQNMTFGLWFEPEMVNPNSDLFCAHPDWVLGCHDQPLGRQQLVLNLALPEVRDYLFDSVSAVLLSNAIDYIKWDHNRVLPMPDADQTRGVYTLLSRLRSAFPDVEIESCASGGGRIDYGILKHAQRVWLSDSNDALERLRIQHNAALFLPMSVTGSHVGPRICHTSGRVLDIDFRAWVAAQRHMGFEMDPRELTEPEENVLRDVTGWWKRNRDWLCKADILRLDSSDPSIVAEKHLSADGQRFVVFSGKIDSSSQISPRPLPLTQLDSDAQYRVTLINAEKASRLSRGEPALKTGAIVVSGAWLMGHGLILPWSNPQSMWVVEGEQV